MECMRLRPALHVRRSTCSGSHKHGCRLHVANGNQSNTETRNESTQRHTNKRHRDYYDEIYEKAHWEQKDNIRKQAQTETHNEPENEITELQNFHKPTAGTINYREGHFRDIAKIRLEQKYDPIL